MSRWVNESADLGYVRASVGCGFGHIGVGAFHRAHQARYADDLLRLGETDCGIVGINLDVPDLTSGYRDQDGLYRVLERNGDREDARLVGAMREFHYAPSDVRASVERLSDERIHFVTLTITEKGYCARPGLGEPDLGHPGLVHDIEHPAAPVTAPGLVVAVLHERRRRGAPPVTFASCDNVPNNGRLLKSVVLALARAQGRGEPERLLEGASFPGSMVDRIVPAMAEEDRAALPPINGKSDRLGVATESFRQWVLENDFAGERPPLERAGVTLVPSAAPYEKTKFRLVNATQSALAHLGYLCGFEAMYEAASDERLGAFALALMRTQVETLGEALDVIVPEEYVETTLSRLRNPAIRHTTLQIGSESSVKVPHRILLPAAERLAAGLDISVHVLVVAAWITYLSRLSSPTSPVALDDPMAGTFRRAADAAAGEPRALTDAFLAIEGLFPASLSGDAAFRDLLTDRLLEFSRHSPLEVVQRELA